MTTPRDTTRNYFQPAKASKPKRKGIRRMSTKKALELKEYTRLRAEFMAARPVCEVWLKENGWDTLVDGDGNPTGEYFNGSNLIVPAEHLLAIGAPRSEECHHREGRGKNYLNVSTWLAVSAEAHRRIHNRPGQARAAGWLK